MKFSILAPKEVIGTANWGRMLKRFQKDKVVIMEKREKKELTLQEIQQAALQVLIRFDQICKENDFKYFLIYGTLLGAIRHKGFIPWDDDIDVMMPRKDFDSFVIYMETHEKELAPLKLHTRRNTKNYCYGIPRLSDMTYKYITTETWGEQFDIGVFIDIYPWDDFGNNEEQGEALWKKCMRINTEYRLYLYPKNQNDGILRAVERTIAHNLICAVKGKYYHNKVDEVLREYVMSNTSVDDVYYGLVIWATRVVQFEKSRLMNLEAIPHEFEGYTFNIPAAYDYLLQLSYGDYMELPPVEQRQPTHLYHMVRRIV